MVRSQWRLLHRDTEHFISKSIDAKDQTVAVVLHLRLQEEVQIDIHKHQEQEQLCRRVKNALGKVIQESINIVEALCVEGPCEYSRQTEIHTSKAHHQALCPKQVLLLGVYKGEVHDLCH